MMMKTYTLLCLLILLLWNPFIAYSQGGATIGINLFASESNGKKYTNAITTMVSNLMSESGKFRVVDFRNTKDVVENQILQSGEGFIHSETVEIGKLSGAEYLLFGKITNLQITRKMQDRRIVGYRASISLAIQFTDIESGILSNSQVFVSKGAKLAFSQERAIQEAFKTFADDIEKYFKKNFVKKVKVVNVKTGGETPKPILVINMGESSKTKKGTTLKVFTLEKLEGVNEAYETMVGKIKVSRIAGSSLSDCTILQGAEAIIAAFNNKTPLICKEN